MICDGFIFYLLAVLNCKDCSFWWEVSSLLS